MKFIEPKARAGSESCFSFPQISLFFFFIVFSAFTTQTFGQTNGVLPPVNDEPCDAIHIYCGNSLNGTSVGATDSGLSDPSCSNNGSKQDVFYTFIPSVGNSYSITVNGSSVDAVLSAYTGTCTSIGTELDCSDGVGDGVAETISFTATSTDKILVRVYDYFNSQGSFTIDMDCSTPDNNNCASARSIPIDGGVVSGINVGATGNINLSIDCGSIGETGVQKSVWFKFQAPPTGGKLVIETFAGTMADSQIQIYDFCGGNVIACDDDSGDGYMSKIELVCDSYIPYNTYYILVDGWSGAQGTFDISIVSEECPPPFNDDCSSPIYIPLNDFPIQSSNSGATGSPDISIDCTEGLNDAENDVWFTFTAPVTGVITIETFYGTLIDTQLQVLDACDGNVIACDEDNGYGELSKIVLTCDSYIPEHTYLVQVDGSTLEIGTFSISVTTSPCPSPTNDGCGDAIPLTVHNQGDCSGNEVSGTTSGATVDGSTDACEPNNPDVFYTFNSGDNTSVNINMDGIPGTDMLMTVLEEFCSGNIVFCYGNLNSNIVEVTPNTIYVIRISTNSSFGDPGAFTICIEDGYDCLFSSANIGDPCNDGNPNTHNDVITEDCTCAGSTVSYGTISGTVDGWNSACADRSITVSLTNFPGSNTYSNLAGVLHPDGSFQLNSPANIIAGTYQVLIKPAGVLDKLKIGVAITAGANSIAFPAVKLGDMNNDNFINFVDFSLLNAAFGSATGDGNYNSIADLNCDGFVNFIDFSVLNSSFGQTGDYLQF